MSCFNFIILKVNGTDVSNLPYEEAVELFLNAEEPIIVEVRRKCLNESNAMSFFKNDDSHKPSTLAVIASSSSNASQSIAEGGDGTPLGAKDKPSISTISCQTDLSFFGCESKDIFVMKSDSNSRSEMFFERKSKHTSTDVEDTYDDYLKTEFDFEEITLKKCQDDENLGFTISYSTEDFLEFDSSSDEREGECCIHEKKRNSIEYNLDEKNAPRFKIYVSDIIPNSLADRDGRLRRGDRILQINGQNVFENVDPNKLLRENKDSVTILVSRYAFGDDEFLDSAVYCDDKDSQEDKHLPSVYENEQSTFSASKSFISKPNQANSSSTTAGSIANPRNVFQILPSMLTENVSENSATANIQIQFETIDNVMKQFQTERSVPQKVKTKTSTTIKHAQCKTTAPNKDSQAEFDAAEHIYETIPEDIDSDVYYCSPYEGVNERRVEEWLKSIGGPIPNIQSVNDKSRIELQYRLQKQNPNLDDYDNSSSAYNTGGSCSSAFLALDQHSKPILDCQKDRHISRTLVSKSINKKSQAGKNAVLIRKADSSRTGKCQTPSYDSGRIQIPSTIVPFKSPPVHIDAAADSDGHSTLVAKSTVYRMCQSKAIEEYKEQDMTGIVWKVKRRPDGTRYIVRRIPKKHNSPTAQKNLESTATAPDSACAIETDYKRQVHRIKERRSRHKPPVILSKEKAHSQHWLV